MDWFERHWGVRWMAFARTMAVTACLCPVLLHAADVGYDYDEAGRLVQVRTAAGSAQYRYDLAGNLIAVERSAAGAVSLAEIAPNHGPVGTLVTLLGSGFAASPAGNVVRFNGVVSSVMSASPSRLTVVVPATATSGSISVTVAAQSATSAESFEVTTLALDSPPVVTNPSSALVSSGSLVTLAGSGFGNSIADVWVRVNGRFVPVVSVSPTEVTFLVPDGATSGGISVGTRAGAVSEAGILLVPPPGFFESDIGVAATLTVGGPTETFNVPVGKFGLFTFRGEIGQALGLGISAVTTSPTVGRSVGIELMKPDGSTWSGGCPIMTSTGTSCDIPALPSTGFYSLLVTPETGNEVGFSLTLTKDVEGRLVVDGPAQPVVIERVGQNARYVFTATRPQLIVELFGSNIPPYGTLTVFDEFENEVASSTTYESTEQLLVSGLVVGHPYRVAVSPPATSTGQAFIRLGNPDLVVTNLSLGAVRPGLEGTQIIPATFTVTNIGGVSVTSSWYDTGYLSADAALDDADQSDDVLNQRLTPLAPGASYTLTVDFVASASTVAGTYTLFVKADGHNVNVTGGSSADSGDVSESNENNNVASATVQLGSTQPEEGEVPLPGWALLGLASALCATLRRRRSPPSASRSRFEKPEFPQ